MATAEPTLQDFIVDAIEDEAEETGVSFREAERRIWSELSERVKSEGIDPKDFVKEHFRKPYEPHRTLDWEDAVEEFVQEDLRARAKVDEQMMVRSPSTRELIKQQKRVGQEAIGQWGRTVAPLHERLVPPPMTDPTRTVPQTKIEIPVSAEPIPESRYAMEQRLRAERSPQSVEEQPLSQREYEQRLATGRAQRALEATVINEKSLSTHFEEIEEEEEDEKAQKLIKARTLVEQRGAALHRVISDPKLRHYAQRGGIYPPDTGGHPSPRVGPYSEKAKEEARANLEQITLPPEPEDWTDPKAKKQYYRKLAANPAIRRVLADEQEEEAYELSGGVLGVPSRIAGVTAGAIGGAGVLAAEWILEPAADFLFAQIAAVPRAIEYLGGGESRAARIMEESFGKRLAARARGESWADAEWLKDANVEAMYRAGIENNKLIESRLADQDGWKAVRGDFADNVGALGELVALFMPTTLDLLKMLRAQEGAEKYDPDDLINQTFMGGKQAARAALTFEQGFKTGMALPAGMAGAILSILSDPWAAVQAQPITTAMTLFPLFKLLKMAKVGGAGRLLDQLDDIAKRAGIDLSDPKYQALTIPERMANRLINEARMYGRTKWAKATQSSLGRFLLKKDYIKGLELAAETGTRAPELLTMDILDPGLARTAKAAALTYAVSQEDKSDTLTVLTAFVAPSLTLRGLAKTRYGPSVDRWKAATGRIAVNIALMADPKFTASVQQVVDKVLQERNLLESDVLTLKHALGTTKGRAFLDKLVPKAEEILAARATLKGRVEGLPAVQEAKSAWEAATEAVEEAEQAGVVGDDLQALKDTRLEMRTEFRRTRARALRETGESSVFIAPESGALDPLRRLVQRTEDIKIELENALARYDLEEVAEIDKIKKANTPEKIAQLRDDLTRETLAKVGMKDKGVIDRFGVKTQEHLDELKRLEEDVKTRVGEDLNEAIARYEARVAAAELQMDKRLKRNAKNDPGATNYETSLLDEMRKAETELIDDLADLRLAAADETANIQLARKAVLDQITRQRFKAAERVQRGQRGLKKEALTRDVETPIAAKEAELAAVQDRYVAKREAKTKELDEELGKVYESIGVQEKTIETHVTRATESTFLGDIADGDLHAEGRHVYEVNAVARFNPKAGRMEYLDADGLATTMDVQLPEGPRGPKPNVVEQIREVLKLKEEGKITPAEFELIKKQLLETGDTGQTQAIRVGVLADDTNATPKRLEGAYLLESLAMLSGDQANQALKSLVRATRQIANSDLGFQQTIQALGGKVKGGMGGRNVAARIYMQIFHDILVAERSSALLRSPALRNHFSKWLNKEIGEALRLPDDAAFTYATRKKIKGGLGKLVNDYAFGRTRGVRYLEINPIIELADGTSVPMSELYNRFMNKYGTETTVRRARVEALDAFRQQMLSKVEEAAASKWFWEQIGGRAGWTDSDISIRYMADIGEYFAENGHLPPLLKSSPKFIKSLWLENEKYILDDLTARLLKKDPELSQGAAQIEARNAIDRSFAGLKEEGATQWIAWKENILPSLMDRGTPTLAIVDDGAGIARWKAPTAIEDMAGWMQMMGHMDTAFVNKGLGGSFNSTIGWLFMANRAMQSGGFFSVMRRMSSAMKRNLTTQRPQTALTNFMSNYLAMITREGLMPQEAAWDIIRTGNLWRQFRKDPKSLPPQQARRLKGFMDRGITSNNAVNVDANIVLETFDTGVTSKAVDLYATGVRRLPVVGKIMRTADAAYQAGDGIFKLTDAERAIGRLDGWQQQLRPGNSITYLDDSRDGFVVGRAFRNLDGELEVNYKGKQHKGKMAEKYLEEMKMDAAVGYANGLYHDYSRVPGFIEIARNFDAFMFGPFKTWAWKSLDIPLLKRGMGTRALFGSPLINSTDANVMASMYRQQTLQSMRKASIFALTRTNNRDDEYLRAMLPEWLAQSAFFDDESLSFQSMGARNFAIGASNILDALWKLTRGEAETVIMRKFRKKEKPAHSELAKMVFADGIVTGTLLDLLEGKDNYGNAIASPKDYFHFLAQKLAPGWVYSATDTLGTMIDSLSDLSNMGRSNRFRDPQTRMEMAEYLVKIWTGRRLEHFDKPTIIKTLGHLVGEHTWPKTSPKYGTPIMVDGVEQVTELDKYFNREWKKDWKEWQARKNAPPKMLQEYKEKQRVFWDKRRDKLRSIYLSLAHSMIGAWNRQQDAAEHFQKMAKKAEESKTEALRLDTQLEEESGEEVDREAMIEMTGGVIP